MKKFILSAIIMAVTSTSLFANTGALDLSCTNTRDTVKNQLGIFSNKDGSRIILSSRSLNSKRGKNFDLALISARGNVLMLENGQIGVKVILNTKNRVAEIFDEQGLVSTCE
jgi:hypothetical protein